MIELRPYQNELKSRVYEAWDAGKRNVMMQLSTGGGKTVLFNTIASENNGRTILIAHRQELLEQISLNLARLGILHMLIASEETKRVITESHYRNLGRSFISQWADIAVGSKDAIRSATHLDRFYQQVTLWVIDEAHHVVQGNTWGEAIGFFKHPQVRGLLPTATPIRADGKGLGAHAHGYANGLVCGPPTRWLIEQRFLTDYRLIVSESDMKMLGNVGESGDWSQKALKDAARRSHITGDVVEAYLKHMPGKLCAVFSTDIETASDMAIAYRERGVRAEVLSGKTPTAARAQILQDFATRRVEVLVTVDIISEGFDLPALEGAQFARPTESLSLYFQQFGRALRPLPGKAEAVIIDHVGNFRRHQGGPDRPIVWSLEPSGPVSSGAKNTIQNRLCTKCGASYWRALDKCPHCDNPAPPPQGRDAPALVAGRLVELAPEVLAKLRGDYAEANMPLEAKKVDLAIKRADPIHARKILNLHEARLMALLSVREHLAEYGGYYKNAGYSDGEIQSAFFLEFGMDILTALSLHTKDALKLVDRVKERIEQLKTNRLPGRVVGSVGS